jgi:hypothetical protein
VKYAITFIIIIYLAGIIGVDINEIKKAICNKTITALLSV